VPSASAAAGSHATDRCRSNPALTQVRWVQSRLLAPCRPACQRETHVWDDAKTWHDGKARPFAAEVRDWIAVLNSTVNQAGHDNMVVILVDRAACNGLQHRCREQVVVTNVANAWRPVNSGISSVANAANDERKTLTR
jgi:hypothetical protein